MKIIIIGCGAVGFYAAKRLMQHRPDAAVHIFDRDPTGLFAKIRLPEYIAGTLERSKLVIGTAEQLEAAGIKTHLGESIISIDRATKTVVSDAGTSYPYDKLLFATGAAAAVPPIKGINQHPRVRTLRMLSDADELVELAGSVHSAIVMGGGLLGLEGAWALRKRGLDVTILECLDRLLPMQLSETESARLQEKLEALGCRVVLDRGAEEITAGNDDWVRVRLSDGSTLEASMMLVSTGIRPNIQLAQKIGLACNRAIVVDNALRTTDPDIYAAGDCAEVQGHTAGLWVAAKDQGTAVADILGGVRETFDPPTYRPKLKISEIDLSDLYDPA